MVESTEKNKDDVKVIAIKLPFDLQERILSFPFLHALRERYPEAEIHFITPKKEIEVLNLLPFTAFYHEFDEDEIKSVFDVHRYCANAKIFNVDLFISLTNSFADACLGLGLRAKERLGFGDGWNGVVLTKKNQRPRGLHITEDFISLYKELVGSNVDVKARVMSRDLSPIIENWDTQPYIAINLSPLRNAGLDSDWIELLSMFENQRIVFFASEEQEKVQVLIQPFLARLPKKNLYINFVHKSWIDLAKMLAFARGVITYEGPIASLSAYVGSKTLVLYDREDPQRTGPFYFLADVMIMGASDPTLTVGSPKTGVLNQRRAFDMGQVLDKSVSFFKLDFNPKV
ncbi:MAG: glycosyltransferase family 9 protein [Bacteriovoracaceae bacterium]